MTSEWAPSFRVLLMHLASTAQIVKIYNCAFAKLERFVKL